MSPGTAIGTEEVLELDLSMPDVLPGLNLDSQAVAAARARATGAELEDEGDSRLLLRCGPLLLDGNVAGGGSEYRAVVAGLTLDDLEAGSLRGVLTAAALEANMEAKQGRASLSLDSLRYANLCAAALSSSVRWERDVLKLEETVMVQKGSRYELSGELFLPDMLVPLPDDDEQQQQQQQGTHNNNNNSQSAAAAHGTAGVVITPSQQLSEQAASSLAQRQQQRKPAVGDASIRGVEDDVLEPDEDEEAVGEGGAGGGAGAASPGRWRLSITVPHASLQDLLPAAQLVSATQQAGGDYSSAKTSFLGAVHQAGVGLGVAQGLSQQAAAAAAAGAAGGGVQAASLAAAAAVAQADAAQPALMQQVEFAPVAAEILASGDLPPPTALPTSPSAAAAKVKGSSSSGGGGGTGGGAGGGGVLPALQDLTGMWSGSIQIFGGSHGASVIEFGLQGREWRWGAWQVDRLVAAGVADSAEGVALEELSVTAGPARALLKGNLLGVRQDAQLTLRDFPLDMLQPLYSALPPALQGGSQLGARGRGNPYLRPFSHLARRLESTLTNLSDRLLGASSGQQEESDAAAAQEAGQGGTASAASPPPLLPQPTTPGGGPVSGLLYMDGCLTGSLSAPEAVLDVRLEQGAVGQVKLAQAMGHVSVDAAQHALALVELVPADRDGHVRASAVVQLPPAKRPPPSSLRPPPHSSRSSSSSSSSVGNHQAANLNRLQQQQGQGQQQQQQQGLQEEDEPEEGDDEGLQQQQQLQQLSAAEHGPMSRSASIPLLTVAGADSSSASTRRSSEWLSEAARTWASRSAAAAVAAAASDAGSGYGLSLPRTPALQEQLDAQLSVADGGMAVLGALLPAVEWQAGSAAIDVRVHGQLRSPEVDGSVVLGHATLTSPMLKHPVTALKANVQFDGSHVVVNGVDARMGKHGSLHIAGHLPLHPPPPPDYQPNNNTHHHSTTKPDGLQQQPQQEEIVVNIQALDLRIANVYSGLVDAALVLEGSIAAPYLGGRLCFSRGTLSLLPPAPPPSAPAAGGTQQAAAALAASAGDEPAAAGSSERPMGPDAQLVASAFSLLKAGRKRAILSSTAAAARHALHPAARAASAAQQAALGAAAAAGPGPELQLSGLEVVLGPEFKAQFPLVLSASLTGQVTLHGPLRPDALVASGALTLESATLNLVATQFVLDRDHDSRILFLPDPGGVLDPVLDVVLVSGDLRAVLAGRGSNWQDALSLSASGKLLTVGGAGGGGAAGAAAAQVAGGGSSAAAAGGGAAGGSAAGGRKTATGGSGGAGGTLGAATELAGLEPHEVARVFEERLAEALLGENGQLALRSLASSTLHTLLPKLETRGQLGAARWRLVGAPALPNLLGMLDLTSAAAGAPGGDDLDPAKLLSRLAVGTELELQWGKSLSAALMHKLLSDTQIGTQAQLTYRINDYLRLQLQLQGLTRPSLMLGYTSAAQ